jgi:hypothetical protein
MHALTPHRQRKLCDSSESRGQSAHPSDSISQSDTTNSSHNSMTNAIYNPNRSHNSQNNHIQSQEVGR